MDIKKILILVAGAMLVLLPIQAQKAKFVFTPQWTAQEGNDQYEYFVMDWYQQCKLLDRPVWTEPFMDYNPGSVYSKDMIASYCKPMKDKKGQFVGTISVDLSLSWLSKTISAVKPYPNSYSIMVGAGGTYFVHPDTTKLFYQTVFTETLKNPDPDREAIGHAMLNGEEGMREIKVDGKDCYVFYKPLSTTGWSVAIVCPASDIFGGYNRLYRAVADQNDDLTLMCLRIKEEQI